MPDSYIIIASAERHLSGPDCLHLRNDNKVEAALFPDFATFEAGHESVKSYAESVSVDDSPIEVTTGDLSTIEQAVEAHQATCDARDVSLGLTINSACRYVYVSDADRDVTIHHIDDGTTETITLKTRRGKRNA